MEASVAALQGEAKRDLFWPTVAVLIGSFISILNITIVNIVIPEIMASFGTTVDRVKWVITVYMLSQAVLMPMVGWLGRVMGNRKLYIVSLGLFCLGAVLCGTAWDIDSLIVFRIIQGIGGGVLYPLSMAMLIDIYPVEKRGTGVAMWVLSANVGSSIGPTLGGFLTEWLNWRLAFYAVVPVAILAMVMTSVFFPREEKRPVGRFDVAGFITLAVFLSALLIALSRGQTEGWGSDYIVRLLIIFAVAFGVFLIVELRKADPLIEIRLAGDRYFAAALIINFLVGIGLYGTNFLVPIFMQNVLDYSVLRAGVAMIPGALIAVPFTYLGGWLTDRSDVKVPLLLGLFFWGFYTYVFSTLDLRVTFLWVVLVLLLRGIGLGVSAPPMMAGAMVNLPVAKTRMASGILSLNLTLGGMFGIAVLGTMLESRQFVHFVSYAKYYDPSSYPAMFALNSFQSLFQSVGHVGNEAKGLAVLVLSTIVSKEALISAFQDSFFFITATFGLALIPSLFMSSKKLVKP